MPRGRNGFDTNIITPAWSLLWSENVLHWCNKSVSKCVVSQSYQANHETTFEYKKDAVIVDVGISRDETGLHGDAIPNLPVALQTPVPGGVGLLTRLALYENLLKIVESK